MITDNNKNLLKKFATYSFIAFAITGVILVYVITMHIKKDFSIFMPKLEIEQHLMDINGKIIFIVFLGLLILYLLFIRIINSVSKKLIEQNHNLITQKYKLEEAYNKLQNTYRNTVSTLSKTVDARDSYTAGHSERVTFISLKLAEKLGLEKRELENIELAAQFHDIGKIGVPDSILLKKDRLTDNEFDLIKKHPIIGMNILSNIEFLKEILQIILHHHENYDGSGYPYGISGNEIPIGSRIISIADTYDSMTSDRPYRKALTHEEAVNEIIRCKGTQFDPRLIETTIDVIRNLKNL